MKSLWQDLLQNYDDYLKVPVGHFIYRSDTFTDEARAAVIGMVENYSYIAEPRLLLAASFKPGESFQVRREVYIVELPLTQLASASHLIRYISRNFQGYLSPKKASNFWKNGAC